MVRQDLRDNPQAQFGSTRRLSLKKHNAHYQTHPSRITSSRDLASSEAILIALFKSISAFAKGPPRRLVDNAVPAYRLLLTCSKCCLASTTPRPRRSDHSPVRRTDSPTTLCFAIYEQSMPDAWLNQWPAGTFFADEFTRARKAFCFDGERDAADFPSECKHALATDPFGMGLGPLGVLIVT